MSASPAALPTTTFRALELDGVRTGVLDIRLTTGRRVLSVPSQLGCRVGCTFCISSTQPLLRNLRSEEMAAMVRLAFKDDPDTMPTELSFTGEGEPVLNWKECERTCALVAREFAQVTAVRYCFSGLGAPRLLEKLSAAGLPMRLQFSLHAARQEVRNRLVPRSEALADIRDALIRNEARFSGIDLNVVLQDGVNDSDEDAAALTAWWRKGWRVALNPLLTEGGTRTPARMAVFEQYLRAAGVHVARYEGVGQSIGRGAIYQRLTFSRP